MHTIETVLFMLHVLVDVRVQTKISYLGKLWLSLVSTEWRASDCECRTRCPNKELNCDLKKHFRTADNGWSSIIFVGWDLIILNVKKLTSWELPHRALGSLCERGKKHAGCIKVERVLGQLKD
jgi:hypothetical protein